MSAYQVVLRNMEKGTVTPSGLNGPDYHTCRAQLIALEQTFDFLHAAGCRAYLAVEPVREVAR